jgi:hypothetical protein
MARARHGKVDQAEGGRVMVAVVVEAAVVMERFRAPNTHRGKGYGLRSSHADHSQR